MERLTEYFKKELTPEIINNIILQQINIKELELKLQRITKNKILTFEDKREG